MKNFEKLSDKKFQTLNLTDLNKIRGGKMMPTYCATAAGGDKQKFDGWDND